MGVVIDYTSGFFEATPTGETVGSVSGNATLDLTSGNVFNHTPTANTTFVLSNPPASGTAQGFTLALTGANIASGYDLANASYDSVSFSVASQENSPAGLAFNNSGTKMYIVGLTSDSVFQYSLSTAFDVSTASYDSVSFSVSSQDTVPTEVIFNNAGTKMYIVGNANKTIYQYSLSTAFDLSTASYDSVSFSVISQESALYGMNFNNDGTKMYVIGASDYVFQYSLSTAFDLSTASYDSVSFSVTSQDNFPYQVVFNSDGTKMYIVGNGSDTVYQYSLSTAFDVSTASYDSVSFSVSSQDTSPLGIVFNSDGTKMYIVGLSNDAVYQYSTGSSALATIAYPSSVNFAGGTAPDAPANGETDILTFYTSDGGTTYQGFKAGDAMS